ncbi:MAG: TRAP transporter substrate-binding protein [Alphaproteobacteria bacterium]|jgi:TRAP-type mannitol/chloroaromatic compound transport system substrate-binding protein
MKRRDFLTGAATGLALGAGATYAIKKSGTKSGAGTAPKAPAITKGKREWKMVTTWPEKFPGLGTSAERLAQRITAMSDGALTVKVFGSGTMVPAMGSFDAVAQGSVEMGHGASYYWQGKSKAFNFFAAVPFGLTGPELSAWIHWGGGQALWDEGYAKFGLKPFLAGNTGVQMGGWFKKEIHSMEDFRGLKMRMPGLGGETLRRVGATAESLAGGDIFPALSSGRIDATEWVGPWNDLAFGFYKIAKNYYWPGFHEPGTGIECFVNKAKYDALPDDLKAIVTSACRAESDAMLGEFNHRNGAALKFLVEKHGVKLRKFPDDVMTALGKAASVVLSELEGADDLTRRTYNSFRVFRDEAVNWSRLSDQGYLDMRYRMLKSG